MEDSVTVASPVASGQDAVVEETPGCVSAMASACAPTSASESGGGGGGWLSGIWSTARTQSVNMMGFMRRDLSEFVSVVRTDTKEAVQRTADAVKESVNRDTANVASTRLKSGLNKFLDTVSTAMTIPPDDSEELTLVYRNDGWHPAKSRLEGRILSLQMDPKTFETAPADEHYTEWLDHFDVDAKKMVISDLLVSNSEIRGFYTRLVPHTILHREFWARYFFLLQAVEAEEARWAALKERAGRQDSTSQDWGDDWEEENATTADEASAKAPVSVQVIQETPNEALANTETAQAESTIDETQIIVTTPSPTEDENEKELVSSVALPTEPDSTDERFRVSERADVVVVKHKDSPESSTAGSSGAGSVGCTQEAEKRDMDDKELDEWEAELDVEVTAEEIEEAKRTALEMKAANQLDDEEEWENWE